jgi:hypothetical protein
LDGAAAVRKPRAGLGLYRCGALCQCDQFSALD